MYIPYQTFTFSGIHSGQISSKNRAACFTRENVLNSVALCSRPPSCCSILGPRCWFAPNDPRNIMIDMAVVMILMMSFIPWLCTCEFVISCDSWKKTQKDEKKRNKPWQWHYSSCNNDTNVIAAYLHIAINWHKILLPPWCINAFCECHNVSTNVTLMNKFIIIY